jgi:parvulin-like peptidyl-prolyl isomerase
VTRVRTSAFAALALCGLLGPSAEGAAPPVPDAAAREARRLLAAEARARGEVVSDAELDRALLALRRRFGDLPEFGRWMKAQDLDERTLFDAVRDELLAARTRARLVQDVAVTAAEEERWFAANQGVLRASEVRLQLIVVRGREQAAKLLSSAIDEKKDFGSLAREHSQGARARQGGDAGWVEEATLAPVLRDAVRGLAPGMATGPLPRGKDSFALVRLHARRPGRELALDEARPEIRRRLLLAKRRDTLERWLERQRAAAAVEVAASGRETRP